MRLVVALALVPAVASAEPRWWWFEAGPTVGFPRGDLVHEDTSWGLALVLGRQFAPGVSVFGAYRKLWVPTTREDQDERYTLHNIEWVLGVRYARRVAGPVAVLVDGEAHVERFKIDLPELASADTSPIGGLGIAGRAGVFVHVGDVMSVGAAVSYSRASIEWDLNVGQGFQSPFADHWIMADAFVGATF